MAYKLAELHGDTVAVPQLVLARLTQTDGNTMRAALYILQTGDTDPHTMARALGLPSVEAARRALQYWAGAGLLEKERGTAAAPAAEAPKKIDLAGLNDPYISAVRGIADGAGQGAEPQRAAAAGCPVYRGRLAA